MSPTNRRLAVKAGWASLITGVLFGLIAALANPAAANDHQVTVCHATGSLTNPYVAAHPTKWQVVAPNGHAFHPGDIVPAFAAGSQGANSWAAFPGLNLHLVGVLTAGCVDAGTTTTTSTSTTSTSTTIAPNGPAGPGGQVAAPTVTPGDPNVVAPDADPSVPLVAGVQVSPPAQAAPTAAEIEALPRTGSSTERLAEVGLGLVLLGLGLLIAGRPLPRFA